MSVRDVLADRLLRHRASVERSKDLASGVSKELLGITEAGDKWVTPAGTNVVRIDPQPRRIIDWPELLGELSPKQRKSVLVEVPDESALEQAVANGTIPAALVEKHSEMSDRTPSIRVTAVDEEKLALLR